MGRIRFLTSGESHGRALVGIIEGLPSGLALSTEDIDRELARRQQGYGRGGRMKIESDHAEILSGVRWGETLGSPVCLMIENRDWPNWSEGMAPEAEKKGAIDPVTRVRPGHADLAGAIKYGHRDVRNVLERSSARETAMRVALGAIAKKFLGSFGVRVGSYVIRIGTVAADLTGSMMSEKELIRVFEVSEESDVRCPDPVAGRGMVGLIDDAKSRGDSLGGWFEVFAIGIPPGLGSHVHWDRRLGSRVAKAVMGIQAIKSVEIGTGLGMGQMSGSQAMDEIFYDSARLFYRATNHAGGIEGGITNGMPLIVRACMKPIPTQARPLRSVDLDTKEAEDAAYERSDVCAVPAAGVIGEAVVALVLADAFLEKFGGDSMNEIQRNYESYRKWLKGF